MRAPEEWYYYTTARRHPAPAGTGDSAHGSTDVNAVADGPTRNHRGPTFANWNEPQQGENGGLRPRTYTAVTIDELHALVHGSTLFARKFAPACEGLEPLHALLKSGGATVMVAGKMAKD